MGTSPFFAAPSAFPDWKFNENLSDKDIVSVHVDDFLGIPWSNFRNGTVPPAAWVAKWNMIRSSAAATGKVLYLAVSPLSNRRTLIKDVDSDGNFITEWAPVDSSGCYTFATDPNATNYKSAYIAYSKYVIDLIQPRFFSPAIEMNIPFSQCPAQKAAWIAWYTDVHNALKTTYPNLTIFPTFQMEHMYGVADTVSSCGGSTLYPDCFQQRLQEILGIPADRIAFSHYPFTWEYTGQSYQTISPNPFDQVQAATARKIWISETGWNAAKILVQYQPSCGADLVPASIANDTKLQSHMAWLLQQAQSRQFEALIWWENRDYLDGTVAATCPCGGTNDTCTLTSQFYAAGGATGELLLRLFANMGLRYYDGTARPAYTDWTSYLNLPLVSTQTINPATEQNIAFQTYAGPVSLQIPAGAFSTTFQLTLSTTAAFPSLTSASSELKPTGVGFIVATDKEVQPSLEVTLSMGYRDSDALGLDEQKLILARYDNDRKTWVPLASSVDRQNNTVTAKTNHFSIFQIVQAVPPGDLSLIKAFPNPLRPSQGHTSMTFSNLPADAKLRVYTLAGELVKDLTASSSGISSWDGTNQSGQKTASGVYFVLVQASGRKKTFKVAVQR